MNKPLVILTGPTAVGKTELSISLAKMINGEIISADSMQVYKHMNIGTAKILPNEMGGITHHLVDILDPSYPFNVAKFKELSMEAIEQIYNKGKIPIIVGGTGFYIQAIIKDVDFSSSINTDYRNQLLEISNESDGSIKLYNLLQKLDNEAAKEIHPNNTKRVIRALEYCHETRNKISQHNYEQKNKKSKFNYAYFVLTNNRDVLYDRINKRVDIMIENGLIDEVSKLLAMGITKDLTSMQGLGYKEIVAYLENQISKESAIELLKRDTRRFAKRQLTWFRREDEVNWIDKSIYRDDISILSHIKNHLNNKDII